MEIMKNKLTTLEFFMLHLISSLDVYVMSYFLPWPFHTLENRGMSKGARKLLHVSG